MKTFLENHVEALLDQHDHLSGQEISIGEAEQAQAGLKNGKSILVIPAQFGQYPVFDGMLEAGEKVRIAMAYADAQKPGTHFAQQRVLGGTRFQVAEDTSPDRAVHIRFTFPEPIEERFPRSAPTAQVVFEQPLNTRARPWEPNSHPVARDFATFLKASDYDRLFALGAYPPVSMPSVSRIMNTDFHSGAELVFHMLDGAAMSEAQRAKYASDLIKLFFQAKGYLPEPVNIHACVQAWHLGQEEHISAMRSDFQTKSAERQALNSQNLTLRELEYLSSLTQTLRNIANEYNALKETLGSTMVLDSVARIARSIPKKEPSKRFRTLAPIAYGMRQALENGDEAAFIQKLRAVITLLSNLERTIQGEENPTGSDWNWVGAISQE